MSVKNKKQVQLGMNPSTAQGKLTRDILWSLVVKTNQDICCKCDKPMVRDTFSIEHVKPWLDSEDPVGLFFDINNIKFSHLRCNVKDARSARKKYETPEEAKAAWMTKKNERDRKRYTSESRRERYLRTGN